MHGVETYELDAFGWKWEAETRYCKRGNRISLSINPYRTNVENRVSS